MATTSSRINAFEGLFATFFDLGLNSRHAGHATNQDDFVDVSSGQTGVFESSQARLGGAADEIADERRELGTGQGVGEVLGTGGIGGVDEKEVDLGLVGSGKLTCLFRRLP